MTGWHKPTAFDPICMVCGSPRSAHVASHYCKALSRDPLSREPVSQDLRTQPQVGAVVALRDGRLPPAVDPRMNPWHPMTNPVDLKTIGKFLEELGETVAAAARCLIQGIGESEPVTGKPNRQWITEEIADVIANAELTIERFGLDREFIDARKAKKRAQLKSWHDMA